MSGADDQKTLARANRRRRMRRFRRKIGAWLTASAGPTLLRALARTWKVEHLHREHYDEAFSKAGQLATLWHGRMIVPLPAHRNTGLKVLVSPSDDGSLVQTLLGGFGYETIRGSSSKSPARALREMLSELKKGGTIVITPDGPRGPRHSVNPGPAWMAKATGFPILPCGFVCDRAWNLRSWDRFTIPKLGARIALVYGQPIYVEPNADDEGLAAATNEMHARMIAAEEQGFRHLGREPDW